MKKMKTSYILIGTCVIALMLLSCFIGVRWGKNLAQSEPHTEETIETTSASDSGDIQESVAFVQPSISTVYNADLTVISDTKHSEEGTENVEIVDYHGAIDKFKEEMNITNNTILETYHVPGNDAIFVNVIDDYVLRETLYFISKQGDEWCCEEFFVEEYGFSDIVEIEFSFRNEKTFVELDFSTGKGNGGIALYRLEDGKLTLLLLIDGAVDRNLDMTTNAVYDRGKLNMYLHENEQNPDFPDVELWGTEVVYGYEEKGSAAGREQVYQMYDILQLYHYDESEGTYVKMTEEWELVQQVEGIYPIWQCW